MRGSWEWKCVVGLLAILLIANSVLGRSILAAVISWSALALIVVVSVTRMRRRIGIFLLERERRRG